MNLRQRLDRFIHHPWVDGAIMVLIVLSVVFIALEATFKNVDPELYHQLLIAGDLLTVIFILELLIRFFVARNKKRFFRQYWIDIIAVIPFARSLRFLRLLRLLRMFRLGLLLTRRLSRLSSIFRGAMGETMIIFVMIIVIVITGALGIRLTEGLDNQDFATLEQSLWWGVMTLVAGEPLMGEPQTTVGRFFALLMMLSGLTLFAMFTGVVSAVMVNRLRNINVRDMELDELRHHTIICGWNRSGYKLIEEFAANKELLRHGIVVLAELENPEQFLQNAGVDPNYLYIVKGDCTQIQMLEHCGVRHADRAILLADRCRERPQQDIDARTVLAAVSVERLNPDIFTCVELINREHSEHLRLMGVEEVIIGEEITGALMALSTRNQGVVTLMDELFTSTGGNHIVKTPAPSWIIGHTVGEAATKLRTEHNTILIGLESETDNNPNQTHRLNPDNNERIKQGDTLVLIAEGTPKLDRR